MREENKMEWRPLDGLLGSGGWWDPEIKRVSWPQIWRHMARPFSTSVLYMFGCRFRVRHVVFLLMADSGDGHGNTQPQGSHGHLASPSVPLRVVWATCLILWDPWHGGVYTVPMYMCVLSTAILFLSFQFCFTGRLKRNQRSGSDVSFFLLLGSL